MFRISKTFSFAASHQLSHLPKDHKCSRLHGHTYEVALEFEAASLGDRHWVRDFVLEGFHDWVKATLDHRHLNELKEVRNPHNKTNTGPWDGPYPRSNEGGMDQRPFIVPTAEVLAKWVYDQWVPVWPDLVAVRVSESPTSWAEYRGAL